MAFVRVKSLTMYMYGEHLIGFLITIYSQCRRFLNKVCLFFIKKIFFVWFVLEHQGLQHKHKLLELESSKFRSPDSLRDSGFPNPRCGNGKDKHVFNLSP